MEKQLKISKHQRQILAELIGGDYFLVHCYTTYGTSHSYFVNTPVTTDIRATTFNKLKNDGLIKKFTLNKYTQGLRHQYYTVTDKGAKLF